MRYRTVSAGNLVLFLLIGLAGCAGASDSSMRLATTGDVANVSLDGAAGGSIERATAETPTDTKRIIYEADLTLVVDSLNDFEQNLPRLVREHGGYIGDAQADRTEGARPSGRWVVRVPVERFEDLLGSLSASGFARRLQQKSQDVTVEYVDLEARISNARQLEQRIAKLLESAPGEVSTIVQVERELARARGELEQLEGRRRLLANRTAYSTITLQVTEKAVYAPPRTPTFGERLARAWTDSLTEWLEVGENMVIGTVAMVPWSGTAMVLSVPPVVFWLRRRRIGNPFAAEATRS